MKSSTYSQKKTNIYTILGGIMKEKKHYEEPTIEIVEFEIEEAIAISAQGTSFWGTLGSEEIWGD